MHGAARAARHTVVIHDVVIIGAGIAGTAAARLLASWGHDVLLVERERAARPPLALSLPPSCAPLLDAIGVRDAIDAAGFVRGTGNSVWWGGTPEAPARLRLEPYASGRAGWQVERGALEALLRRAAREAGVAVCAPAVVRQVAPQPHRADASPMLDVTIDDDQTDGATTRHARWVLDCSGRAGLLARAQRDVPAEARTLALVATWERASGWPVVEATHTLVESAPWGWGWSVPISDTQRCFTAMIDPRRTARAGATGWSDAHGDLAGRYHARLADLPNLGALVTDAQLVHAPWACDATPYTSREVAWPGQLLVGDAASMLDPLSSFGVKKALASAWLAAVTVHTTLLTPEHTQAALTLYRDREAAYVASADAALRAVAHATRGEAADAPFWSDRGELDPDARAPGDALAVTLRDDAAVRAAFAHLRAAPTLTLPALAAYAQRTAPVVRGNVIRPEPHLVLSGITQPVRYLRGVDLVLVLELAAGEHDVGALFDRYTRQVAPVTLPDFLGAVSVLLAKAPTGAA
ncbi:MAG: FAD-dependent oxidoreductase [Gemmatimonadetes bacterium]|nr:FAD-dependent oxidoreductase [Gemmatimonadota bacterium]